MKTGEFLNSDMTQNHDFCSEVTRILTCALSGTPYTREMVDSDLFLSLLGATTQYVLVARL